ncbi:MAG: hypothetical protein ACQCN3_02800 [Candidatus Bathyarchaeia archaeon]
MEEISNDENFRLGVEAALELAIVELSEKSKEEAKKILEDYLGLVKEDKLERLKESLWTPKR